jgi:hypothetical protein
MILLARLPNELTALIACYLVSARDPSWYDEHHGELIRPRWMRHKGTDSALLGELRVTHVLLLTSVTERASTVAEVSPVSRCFRSLFKCRFCVSCASLERHSGQR